MTQHELGEVLGAAQYRFARTMPRNPHWYTLRKTWHSDRLFDAAVLAIRQYGVARPYRGRDYICFDHGGWQYWTMGDPVEETILINRARCSTTRH